MMVLINMAEASELTHLTPNALAAMLESGELLNYASDPNIVLEKAEIERLVERIHILEFYDEFDDELKLREQNTLLGRDAESDGG